MPQEKLLYIEGSYFKVSFDAASNKLLAYELVKQQDAKVLNAAEKLQRELLPKAKPVATWEMVTSNGQFGAD